MTTLFSPVGTADPITQLGDGPMLHIVRHYHPDKVVLFLSPEMQGYMRADKENATADDVLEFGRYEAAIRRLCAAEDRPVPEIRFIDSQCEDVFRFDYHIDEFEEILEELCSESPNEPVLVNVTSGTPGFQQALVALGSFGRLRVKLLQVTTPKKGANSRQDREDPHDYDFEALWEWNEELRNADPQSCVSRVIKVDTPNFADRVLRENTIKLIGSYDYLAAYELVCQMKEVDEAARRMIKAAYNRLNLDIRLSKAFKPYPNIAYLNNDPLGEYLPVMAIRLQQGNWADFVRMLTPALAQLAKKVLTESGLPEEAYLKSKTNNDLDCAKIASNRRLSKAIGITNLDSSKRNYITNEQLVRLVKEFCSDKNARNQIVELRKFEQNCRNPLAHELHASDKETLERIGGMRLEEVLQYLCDLHGNVRTHLYEDINRTIVERL